MSYLILKLIHVISSTILFGTGIGSAFYMLRANQTKNLNAMLFAAKNVVLADWLFTTPAVIIQPLTGLWLVHIAHYPLLSHWIFWSIILYILIGMCWLPVVWLQIKVRDMLTVAIKANESLPEKYYHYMRIWFWLGWPAFIAIIIIFGLMVFKP